MGFLKLLASLFTPASERPRRYVLPLSVQCHRCGEVVHGEINLANDLSAEFGEDGGGATTYVCRKVLMGTGRCFQQIEVELTFDRDRKITHQQVTGGKLLEAGATQLNR
jgi:hypothetical protein